jgi:ribonuclease HI
VTFPFTKEVCKEVERMIGNQNVWDVRILKWPLGYGVPKRIQKNNKALPLNIAWGVWLAKNMKLFEGKKTQHLKCLVWDLNIINSYPQSQGKKSTHGHTKKIINKNLPCAYFDGASLGTHPRGGAGGILYLSQNYSTKLKYRIGNESNNFYELMALKLVLKLAQELGVSHLQIYDDSLLVIQWIHKEITLIKFTLQTLFNDVHSLLSYFSQIFFSYIYKESNTIVVELSKFGIELEQRTWIVSI